MARKARGGKEVSPSSSSRAAQTRPRCLTTASHPKRSGAVLGDLFRGVYHLFASRIEPRHAAAARRIGLLQLTRWIARRHVLLRARPFGSPMSRDEGALRHRGAGDLAERYCKMGYIWSISLRREECSSSSKKKCCPGRDRRGPNGRQAPRPARQQRHWATPGKSTN